jgi:hypothetical protein
MKCNQPIIKAIRKNIMKITTVPMEKGMINKEYLMKIKID